MRRLSLFSILAASVVVTSPCTAVAQPPARPPINGGLPAVSPDGSLIAYSAVRDGTQQIYLIRADGTGDLQLTRSAGSKGRARWMPDGKRILVSAFAHDTTTAFTVNADGSGERPFATVEGRDVVPVPGSANILFAAGRMRMQAGAMVPMPLTIASADGQNAHALVTTPRIMFDASWSPDGKRLAVASMDSTRDMQLWLMNADGSALRQLTHFTDADGHPQWASWSPDGKTLAIQAGQYDRQNPAASTSHIWLVNATTGAATKLAAHDKPWLDETPSFFPDGKRIAFQSDRTGKMEVWVMNLDGTGARQVTR